MQTNNKVILITGATSGIGKATAEALAVQGATIVIFARNKMKAISVIEELKSKSGNRNISFIEADFDSLASLKQAADNFKSRFNKLDVLINNTGLTLKDRQVTIDGFERTFQVNYLSLFLLSHLLINELKASGEGRIINVTSAAESMGKIEFDNLQGEKKYSGTPIYCNSKLMIVQFTYELAERLKETGITVNTLHPGVVRSEFGKGTTDGIMGFVIKHLRFMMIPLVKGAETSNYLALSPEVKGITGKYFVKKKAQRSSKRSYDLATQKKLWQVTEEMLKGYLN